MPKKQVAPPANDVRALSAPVLGQLKRCIEVYDELRRIDRGILDPDEINVPMHKDRALEQTVLDVVELIAGVKPNGNKFKFPDARAKIETAIKNKFVPKNQTLEPELKPAIRFSALKNNTQWHIFDGAARVGVITPHGLDWAYMDSQYGMPSSEFQDPIEAARHLLQSLGLLEHGTPNEILWDGRLLEFIASPVAEAVEAKKVEIGAKTIDGKLESLAVRLVDQASELEQPAVTKPSSFTTEVPWDCIQYQPTHLQPRRHGGTTNKEDLEELAASILAKGVLQNLIVRPLEGCSGPQRYVLVAGSRRYSAIGLLVHKGLVPRDYPVSVRVVDYDDTESLEVATIENIHRKDMHPIDEADAIALLENRGLSREEIAARVGMHITTVHKRLAISKLLTPEVKHAYLEGKIGLSIAEAMTLGQPEAQKRVLKDLLAGRMVVNLENIRRSLAEKHLLVKHAIFKHAEYKGEITEDLFGTFDPFFADAKQAEKLQRAAAEKLRQDTAPKWMFAYLIEERHFYESSLSLNGKTVRLEKSKDKIRAGAFVRIHPDTLEVTVHSGFAIVSSPNSLKPERQVKAEKQALAAREAADIAPSEMGEHLKTLVCTPRALTLAPLAQAYLERIPKRLEFDTRQNTRQSRIEALTPITAKHLHRAELLAALEGTGKGISTFTAPVPNPKGVESQGTFWIAVTEGKCAVGCSGWSGPLDTPPEGLQAHSEETCRVADAILESGSLEQMAIALSAGLRVLGEKPDWVKPKEASASKESDDE